MRNNFVVFPDLPPNLAAKVTSHLLVSIVGHVHRAVSEHVAVESVGRVALREGLVNEEVVIV